MPPLAFKYALQLSPGVPLLWLGELDTTHWWMNDGLGRLIEFLNTRKPRVGFTDNFTRGYILYLFWGVTLGVVPYLNCIKA